MKFITLLIPFLLFAGCSSAPKTTDAASAEVRASSVAYDGNCPMSLCQKKKQKGSADYQVTRNGRTFHFSSEEAKQEFLKNPDAHIQRADANWIMMGDRIR